MSPRLSFRKRTESRKTRRLVAANDTELARGEAQGHCWPPGITVFIPPLQEALPPRDMEASAISLSLGVPSF